MPRTETLDSKRQTFQSRLKVIECQIAEAEVIIYDEAVNGPRLKKALGQRDRLMVEQAELKSEMALLDVAIRARDKQAAKLMPRFAHPIGDDGRAADGIHHITW